MTTCRHGLAVPALEDEPHASECLIGWECDACKACLQHIRDHIPLHAAAHQYPPDACSIAIQQLHAAFAKAGATQKKLLMLLQVHKLKGQRICRVNVHVTLLIRQIA